MLLSDIKGLGEKRIKKLNGAGIFHPEDLIFHLPYKYIDLNKKPNFNELCDGDEVAFIGTVESKPVTKFVRRGLLFVKVKFIYDNLKVGCTWFNQRFIASRLQIGKVFCVSGKIKKFKHSFDIVSPTLVDYNENTNSYIPLYKNIKGLPHNVLLDAINQILSHVTINSYITPQLASSIDIMPLDSAVRELHFPTNEAAVSKASESVSVENLCSTLCIFDILKNNGANDRVYFYENNILKLKKMISSLSFDLTDDQKAVLDGLIANLSNSKTINMLIQGDVGSGKTIIAFLMMYYAALSGFQSVFMAPTEILAKQHYINALKIFENFDVKVEFLSGSQSKAQRDVSLFNIKNGVADIIIGTHALISDDVIFRSLSLVITDEQHRFGVSQRGSLENKAKSADKIVMSATPIPRTLALTLYGDLEQSIIRQKPLNRAKIHTRLVPLEKLDDMYNYLLKKCHSGEQAYIVCPRIEEDDEAELVSVNNLYDQLEQQFSSVGIAIIHGQMRDKDKTEIMRDFDSGKIKILISTTVIEVGIDVKNATSMVIFNAERYGLSQLHQLRGRVGRGEKESYCFVLSNVESAETKKRLNYFCNCSDGFELAEYDFSLRGAGDFLGTRQHGNSNIKITPEILSKAKTLSNIIKNDEAITSAIMTASQNGGFEFIKSLTLN